MGAAAFVLGVSLAGPQATGIAAADGTDSDSPAVSAGSPAPAGRAAHRAGRTDRSGAHAGSTTPGSTTPGSTTPGSAAARTGARVPATPPAKPAQSHPGRTTATTAGAAAGVAAQATPPSAVIASATVPPSAVAIPAHRAARTPRASVSAVYQVATTPVGSVAMLSAAVTSFFDSASHWISGLPASPFTDFLGGAVLLARRTVLSLMPGAGAGQTGAQTQAAPYMTEQELHDYLLALAHQQYAGQFGQTVPVYSYYPYPVYKLDDATQSGTNTQVDGVDEADFVETDGHYVYVAHNSALTILDGSAVASQTSQSGTVVGPFLAGDRHTVITQTGGGWYGPMESADHRHRLRPHRPDRPDGGRTDRLRRRLPGFPGRGRQRVPGPGPEPESAGSAIHR